MDREDSHFAGLNTARTIRRVPQLAMFQLFRVRADMQRGEAIFKRHSPVSDFRRQSAANTLFCGQIILLVFGDVDLLPFALLDALTNLRGSLALLRLLVGVQSFLLADVAAGTVAADEAVQQTAVSAAAIAVTIAGLLVEDFFHAARDDVGIEGELVREE